MERISNRHLRRHYQLLNAGHDEQREHLLQKLRAEGKPRTLPIAARRRWLLPTALSGVAAAVVAWSLIWFIVMRSPSVSWGQVVDHMRHVQTFSCLVKQESRDANGKVAVAMTTTREYLRSPDQRREDGVSASGATSGPSSNTFMLLVNGDGHPHSVLSMSSGTASVVNDITFGLAPGTIRPGQAEWLARLQRMDGKQMVRKGEELVGDRNLVRFDGPSDALDSDMPLGTLTVWADPATSLPVRLLIKAPAPYVQGVQNMTIEMSDMRFDPPLDANLFAWPRLTQGAQGTRQTLMVHVPWHIEADKLKLTIGALDGPVLVETADLAPTQHILASYAGRHSALALKPEARQRVRAFTAGDIGKKLTIRIDDVGTEEIEIVGAIERIYVWMPVEIGSDSRPTQ